MNENCYAFGASLVPRFHMLNQLLNGMQNPEVIHRPLRLIARGVPIRGVAESEEH